MSRTFETSGLRTLGMGLVIGVTSCMAVQHADAAKLSVEAAKAWIALQLNPVQISAWQTSCVYATFPLNEGTQNISVLTPIEEFFWQKQVDSCVPIAVVPIYQQTFGVVGTGKYKYDHRYLDDALTSCEFVSVIGIDIADRFIIHTALSYSYNLPRLIAIRAGPVVS